MSAPASPTGKRLARPIIAGVLPRLGNPLTDPALEARLEAHRAAIRKVGVALVLWLALAALLYLHTVD